MSIAQLNGAKDLARQDPSLYPQVVEGVLNIADRHEIDLRRWAASFLVEAFIAPSLPVTVRVELAVKVLATLKTFLGDQDPLVVKYAVTCLSIIYPLLFEHVCQNPQASDTWNTLLDLKSRALALWDQNNHRGVQAACIKLAQVAILVQSKQQISGQAEVSLSSVPRDHPLIDQTFLSAESQGLLDRMLSYLARSEFSVSEFGATLNSLLPLLPVRPSFSPKIIKAILSCDLSTKKFAGSPDSFELAVRYIEKALQLELRWVANINVAPDLKRAIHYYLAKISEFKASSNLRKRVAEMEGDQSAKRIRMSDSEVPVSGSLQLPTGRVPYSSLYNLVDATNPLGRFNARDLPVEIAINVVLAGLGNVNPRLLTNSIEVINKRYSGTTTDVPPPAETISGIDSHGEEVDQVDGVFAAEDKEKTSDPKETSVAAPSGPRRYSGKEYTTQADSIIERILDASSQAPTKTASHESSKALSRIIIPEWAQDSWVYLVSRVATRGVPAGSPVAKAVRDHLYNFVMHDFRTRLDVMIAWLSEEWYAEYVLGAGKTDGTEGIYYELLGRIVDQLIPRLDLSDSKIFIRLCSELPELNKTIIFKLESIGMDPDRALLAVRTLKFLIMFKPPVKEACLDFAKFLHDRGVQSMASILEKYRPEALTKVEPEQSATSVATTE